VAHFGVDAGTAAAAAVATAHFIEGSDGGGDDDGSHYWVLSPRRWQRDVTTPSDT